MATEIVVGLGSLFGLWLIVLVLFAGIVVNWQLFKRMGITSWHSLIPVLKDLDLGNAVTTKYLAIIYCVIKLLDAFTTTGTNADGTTYSYGGVPAIIVTIADAYIAYRLAKCFGHGVLFTIGLTFFPIIFKLLLLLNGDRYRRVPVTFNPFNEPDPYDEDLYHHDDFFDQ